MVSVVARALVLVLTAVLLSLGGGTAAAQTSTPESATPSAPTMLGGGCKDLVDTVTGGATSGNGLLGAAAQVGCTAVSATPVGAAVNGAGAATEAGKGALNDMADSAFGKIVDSAARSFSKAVIFSVELWLKFPTTAVTTESLFSRIQDNTMWIQVVLLTVSVMVVAGRLAMARSVAGSLEEGENALRSGAKVVAASTLMAAVVIAAGRAGDEFSVWIVKDAAGTDNPLPVMEKFTTASVVTGRGFADAAVLVLILSILGILTSLIQIVFIIIRNMLLIVVVAVLPMSAAASGMSIGRQSYDKMVGFIVALLLFKPIAALIIAVALWTGQSDDEMQQFIGLMLLVLSVLVLPSLMKLIVPAVSAAGMGPSTLAVGAGAVAVGAKAGAMIATGGAAGAAGSVGGAAGAGGAVTTGGGGGPAAPTPPSPGGGTGGGGNVGGGAAGAQFGGGSSGVGTGGAPEGAARGSFAGQGVGPGAGPVGGSPASGGTAGPSSTGTGHSDQFYEAHVNPTPERGLSRHEVEQ